MFAKQNWAFLQLFGEESAAGVTVAADAGQHGTWEPENRAEHTQDAAAKEPQPRRMTWEEIKADPEYNREIQAIIAKRLSRERGREAPAEAPDYTDHFRSLEEQGERMKALFPGFDLRRELSDPAFARLTAPDVGLGVEDAFYTLHRHQIQRAAMEVAAQRAALQFSDAIRSGSQRPRENGGEGQGASISSWDYKSASPQEKAALKKRIREARAKGERVLPFGR